MSGKVRMRCAQCGKHFKSVSAKHTLCPDCEARERAAHAAGKGTPSLRPPVTPVRAQRPTIVGPGAAILVPELAQKSPLPTTGSSLGHREKASYGEPGRKVVSAGRHGEPAPIISDPERADHSPMANRTPKSAKQARSLKAAPHAPDPAASFVLTDDLRVSIEIRYQELAQPVEFDGIRTRIAAELGIPKAVVKRTVADLRKRLQLPSWWELQSYTGSAADLERIRAAYLPYLPVPDVGVHKHLATQLELDSGIVYQGIRRIRAEMRLPQYNPPEAHGNSTSLTSASTTLTSEAEAR
jgi:hypothetical protein